MDRIYLAIGRTCDWWSTIEHLVHDICLHLAECLSTDFSQSVTRLPIHIALSNMDFRERIATAKAFASQAPTAAADFYSRLESLLNRLDNELRSERNRYIHDLWMANEQGSGFVRFQQRTIVTRPQSRELDLQIGTKKTFGTVEEIEAFVTILEDMYHKLVTIDNETATMASDLMRLEVLRKSVLLV